MDFHSLPRRDLQFFCKRNKIPANMTNIAMADALKALEIVEGIDEFVNQSESTYDQSPTSVVKNLPSAARTSVRTNRRKTTKDETLSSELVTRSCHVTSKSLAKEMDQENISANMLQNPSVPQSRSRAAASSVSVKLDVTDIEPEANVSKTPAVRSTRRARAAASCKKDESVQRVYSTRRAVKLLEESMADLCLKTKEPLNVPAKMNKDAEREESPAGSNFQANSDENSEKTEEAEVISVRDLNDSLEKEWDGLKNDLDTVYGDLGDITFSDANTSKEQMNDIASDSFVIVEEQETLQEDDFVVVDHAASTTTNIVPCSKESKSEQIRNDSESESEGTEYETDSEGTEYETDPEVDDDDFGGAVQSKEIESEESEPEEEEISDVVENSFPSEELMPPVSDKKGPATKEIKSLLSPFEAESISGPNKSALKLAFDADSDNKSKENLMALKNNGDGKSEATDAKERKKKTIDEESFKDVSMRQLLRDSNNGILQIIYIFSISIYNEAPPPHFLIAEQSVEMFEHVVDRKKL